MLQRSKILPQSLEAAYNILEDIGFGGYSTVKAAFHQATKTRVALKILDKANSKKATLESFQQEIIIL